MNVTVFRTAMVGGGLSYDVYVKRTDAHQPDQHTVIIRDLDGKRIEWLDYPDATIDPAHWSLPQGWDRYEAWQTHEKAARRPMLQIARRAFPELNHYQGDSLPSLWVTGLPIEETHATRTLEV